MNHGRPSKTAQIHIQEKLRDYFEYGITATLAAEKTGVNIKTVCKYFDEWSESIAVLRPDSFIETEKVARVRAIASYDKQIIETLELSDDVKHEIQKLKADKKPIFRYLFATKLEIQKFLLDICERKIALETQMTPDEFMEKTIAERLKSMYPDRFGNNKNEPL